MKSEGFKTRKEYERSMQLIELLLQKATENGGYQSLTDSEKKSLLQLSLLAEQFEDEIPLMPMKTPQTLADLLRFKMYEKGWRQKQLAMALGVSEAAISGLLTGQRKLNIELAKKLHLILGIDAHFLLMST